MSAYIPTLGTILVAIFTAIFGIYSYQQQKRVDRNNYIAQKDTDRKIDLRNQRMKEYERYITAYQKDTSLYDYDPRPTQSSEIKIKARNELWVAYSNLFQIASDPVLRAASDFHNFWWDYDPTDEEQFKEFRALYATMIMAMRDDVSERTTLSLEEMQERTPFVFPVKQSTEGNASSGERTE